jgi:hypothetical protein
MEIDFVNTSLDILEGIVAGGLIGLGTEITATAVSSLPSAFLTLSMVGPLSVVAGALAFVGYSVARIRTRIKPSQPITSELIIASESKPSESKTSETKQ